MYNSSCLACITKFIAKYCRLNEKQLVAKASSIDLGSKRWPTIISSDVCNLHLRNAFQVEKVICYSMFHKGSDTVSSEVQDCDIPSRHLDRFCEIILQTVFDSYITGGQITDWRFQGDASANMFLSKLFATNNWTVIDSPRQLQSISQLSFTFDEDWLLEAWKDCL